MHIKRDFTLFLSLDYFMVISGVLEGFGVKLHVFEALGCDLRLPQKSHKVQRPLDALKMLIG